MPPAASASRRQIGIRAAVVIGLIVVLLAGLLIFEQGQKPEASLASQIPTPPASSPIGKSLITGVSSPALPEEISKAVREAPDVTQATIASMSAPAASVPPSASTSTVPAHEEPAQSEPAKRNPPNSTPVIPTPAPKSGGDKLVVEGSKPIQPAPAPTKPAPAKPAPTAQAAPPTQPPVLTAPVTPTTPHATGFIVQLGVFNNQSNAEELRTKLALAGIPSQVEMRVQLGPFKNKEEALQAQQKLRTLGLAPGMLIPPRSAEHPGK